MADQESKQVRIVEVTTAMPANPGKTAATPTHLQEHKGVESIYLQPVGSHDTNPFPSPILAQDGSDVQSQATTNPKPPAAPSPADTINQAGSSDRE